MTVRMGKEFQGELPSARAERERLLEKNKRLRQLLTDHGIRIPATQTQGPTLVQGAGSVIDIVSHASDSKAKIALFRNLFRGREESMRCDGKILMAVLDTCPRRTVIGKLTMRAGLKSARKSTGRPEPFDLSPTKLFDSIWRGRIPLAFIPATPRNMLVPGRGLRQEDMAGGFRRFSWCLPRTSRFITVFAPTPPATSG